MPGIVGPGRHFVDQDALIPGHEHLDRQQADKIQGIGQIMGDGHGLIG